MTDQTLWRRSAAAFHLAGAILFMAGMALTPWEPERTTTAYHDALAASPGQAEAAALVLHFAYAALAAGAFALIGAVGGRLDGRRSWWLLVGSALVVLGATSMPGLLITDAYDLALAEQLPRSTSVPVSDAVSETVLAAVIGGSAMLGFIVGPVLVWVAAWRAGLVPAAVPALVVVSWVIGLATMELPVMLTGTAVLIVAVGLATVRLWPQGTSASVEPTVRGARPSTQADFEGQVEAEAGLRPADAGERQAVPAGS